MNPSVTLSSDEKENLDAAIDKLTPAIIEMIRRKDSGEITVYFHEGEFKRAKKTVTV